MYNKFILSISCILALVFFASTLYAEPSVKVSGNRITISEGITDDIMAEIAATEFEKEPVFSIQQVHSPEEISKLCAAYPQMETLDIRSKELPNIEFLAALKNLKSLTITADAVQDFSPLAELTSITSLNIDSKAMGPDLKWMSNLANIKNLSITGGPSLVSLEGVPALPNLSRAEFNQAHVDDLSPLTVLSGLKALKLRNCKLTDLTPLTNLPNLESISLYGATVQDFSPLEKCLALKELDYYATKDADYSTLGKLTQVEVLEGGLTDLKDISWITNLKNLKSFDVFAEHVTDYTPLTSINLEKFKIWNMNVPVGDLSFLSKMVSLKKLTLDDVKGATNLEVLGTLVNLTELKLTKINPDGGEPIPLATIKKLPNLTQLTLSKDVFTEEELTGFANPNISIRQY